MNFFSKSRPVPATPERRMPPGKMPASTVVAVGNGKPTASAPESPQKTGRQSNGLKEFLWQLEGIGHGPLLDLGPARQTTISFFIERGFKVYTEDLMGTWQLFLEEEAQRAKKALAGGERSEAVP